MSSKACKEVSGRIITKSLVKTFLSSAGDGTQNNILWDKSEASDEDDSTSEYDNVSEEISKEHCD